MITSNRLSAKRVELLKKAMQLSQDEDSMEHQVTLPPDEEAIQYISKQSPLDPSSMGFDDYLVNTYDDPHLISQETITGQKCHHQQSLQDLQNQKSSQQSSVHLLNSNNNYNYHDISHGPSNRIETSETNLLDETSKFEKNLNSAVSLSEIGQNMNNIGTTEPTPVRDANNSYHIQVQQTQNTSATKVNNSSISHSDVKQQLAFHKVELATKSIPLYQHGRGTIHELSTNISQACKQQQNGTAVNVLRQGSHIGAGIQVYNCKSNNSDFGEHQNNSSQHQSQSNSPCRDFITFKPNNQISPEQRNPFPRKFKQSPKKKQKGSIDVTTFDNDMGFDENIKKESDCYYEQMMPLNNSRKTAGGSRTSQMSPNVISQHSVISSLQGTDNNRAFSEDAESTAGAQLTLSQLCPAVFENKPENLDNNNNQYAIYPQQVQHQPQRNTFVTPLTYPSQLIELPSRIQEESQEYSYSYANANTPHDAERGQQSSSCYSGSELYRMKEANNKQDSEFNKVQDSASRSESHYSIVHTQESKLHLHQHNSSPPLIMTQQIATLSSQGDDAEQLQKQLSLIRADENDNSINEQNDDNASQNSLKRLQQDFISAQAAIIIKQNSETNVIHQPQQENNQVFGELPPYFVQNREILSETNNQQHGDEEASRRVLGYVDSQGKEFISDEQIKSQDYLLSMPYSNMVGNNSSDQQQHQQLQQQHSIQMYQRDLANALLQQQMSSGRDHFSQRDLALLTSISSEQASLEISRIGQTEESFLKLKQPIQQQLFTHEDDDDYQLDAQKQQRSAENSVAEDQNQQQEAASQQSQSDSQQQSQQTDRSQAMKELYEMRMKGINKKKQQRSSGRPKCLKVQKPTKPKQNLIAYNCEKVIIKKEEKAAPTIQNQQVVQAPVVYDSFYNRNIQWRKQIDDINRCKKQIQDHQNIIKEVEQCTFQPELVTEKYKKDLKRCTSPQEIPASHAATKSHEQVEDRCLQWADHAKNKKEKTVQRLQKYTECTFNPTLISKQFKNRVCPNYDFKHQDQRIVEQLEEEYNYFTLRNYLKMNDESKQDLEKLCQLYSSNGSVLLNNTTSANVDQPQINEAREKMLLIAEFIERSQNWQKSVEQKKEKVAELVDNHRNKENTFHPKINSVSEHLHSEKMNMLEQVNNMAAAKHKDGVRQYKQQYTEQDAAEMPLQAGLLEKETKENLFEYYLPKRTLMGQNTAEDVSSSARRMLNQDLPLSQQSQREQTSSSNKNAVEKDISTIASSINVTNESKKFTKLIEQLNQRLDQDGRGADEKLLQPQIIRGDFMPRQMDTANQKKGDKKDDKKGETSSSRITTLQTEREIQNSTQEQAPQQQLANQYVSFQQHDTLEKEIELIESMKQLLLNQKLDHNSSASSLAAKQLLNTFSLSQRSEETSRFLQATVEAEKNNFPSMNRLDLTQLTQKTSLKFTPTMTDPIVVLAEESQQYQQQSTTKPFSFHPDTNNSSSIYSKLNSSDESKKSETRSFIYIDDKETPNQQNTGQTSLIDMRQVSQQCQQFQQHSQQSFDYEQALKQSDGSTTTRLENLNSTPLNKSATSSSMRKHLNYIYKRNLSTSRRNLTDQHQQQQVDTITTDGLHDRGIPTSAMEPELFFQRANSCRQIIDNNSRVIANNSEDRPQDLKINQNHSVCTEKMLVKRPWHQGTAVVVSNDDNIVSETKSGHGNNDDSISGITERRKTYHRSNTSNLFKKRNKSDISDNSLINLATPRTDIPLLNNDKIIHSEQETLIGGELTQTISAKKGEGNRGSPVVARSFTEDPKYNRLALKLRGLRQPTIFTQK